MTPAFPAASELVIGFGHSAYQLGDEFARRNTGIRFEEFRTAADFHARLPAFDVVVASGFWRGAPLEAASRLRFIQSVSAGVDMFDQAALKARGVRLASAKGANANAVAEHAMGLILAFSRMIHTGRDNQSRKVWRGMIGDPSAREFELAGKTLLIVGLGGIGARLARFAKAFDMTVVGLKRDTSARVEAVDRLVGPADLDASLADADIVALTCPLTAETEGLINAGRLAAMKPTALLVNCARGRVVDEDALVDALKAGRIAGAALDVTREEPLQETSPLWSMENVIITPHTGGETADYERLVVDMLIENLGRLTRGEALLNPVV
ncbi:D-2-hydroxyacid dehydrogenase [Phreatobacter sp.]|uniref:D-2-hydroxyacid dehydrogenase n=1 Tax=Phreatobacter sp. TaxID=1966341 RepID=UPI003F6F8B44